MIPLYSPVSFLILSGHDDPRWIVSPDVAIETMDQAMVHGKPLTEVSQVHGKAHPRMDISIRDWQKPATTAREVQLYPAPDPALKTSRQALVWRLHRLS